MRYIRLSRSRVFSTAATLILYKRMQERVRQRRKMKAFLGFSLILRIRASIRERNQLKSGALLKSVVLSPWYITYKNGNDGDLLLDSIEQDLEKFSWNFPSTFRTSLDLESVVDRLEFVISIVF